MADAFKHRVLLMAPHGGQGLAVCGLLEETGVHITACDGPGELVAEAREGVGAILLAEEDLDRVALDALMTVLDEQPPWSDLPIVVLTRTHTPSEALFDQLAAAASLTFVELPLCSTTLVAAVHAALRARRRQYQVGALLERLTENERRREEFVAMLGHELRNPLSALCTAATMLGQTQPTSSRTLVDIIDRQSKNLVRMLDDLLDVSRVTRGKVALRREPLDLRELVRRRVDAVRGAPHGAERVIELDAPPAPLWVNGDPMRIEQIFTNLLHNALKYSPSHLPVRVVLEQEGELATLRVCDQGAGIPREMLGSIFELFVQVDKSIDRRNGGLGLGLPLVRALVQLHGGTVEAHSEGPGRGSELVVRLPLARLHGATEYLSQRVDAMSAAATPLDVLIADDNDDARQMLQLAVQSWGHRVETADSGPSAVDRAIAMRPSVAIVDIGLPGIDGYQVARCIRAALGDGCRLLALTGYGRPEDRARALAAGFDDHLVKPVSFDRLRHMLDLDVRRSA